MIASRFVRLSRLDRLERDAAAGASDRAIALAFHARLVDEVLSGAWTVLTPTFRRVFDLTLVQLGLLAQVLEWVALVVEPPAATLIDLRSRRALLAFGGTCVGLSVVAMGAAPGYAGLLAAFAVYGLGSGPLAHTADVVIVEAFAPDADRAFARATMLDTLGALAGPALVALAYASGVSWRVVLTGAGSAAVAYGIALAFTRFPAPRAPVGGVGLVAAMRANLRRAVATRESRRALVVLLWFDLFESAFILKYVWLAEDEGFGQSGAALYAVGEQVVAIAALAVLDRLLVGARGLAVLRVASGLLVVLPAAWVAAPGIAGIVVVGAALAAVQAFVWPIARSRALAAVPDVAGAVSAVTTLYPVLPLVLVQTRLAQAFGTPRAMAATAAVGAALMLATTFGRR